MKEIVWCSRAIVTLHNFYGLCTTEKMFQRELRKMNVPKADWPAFIATPQSDATCHFFDNPEHGESCIVTLRDTAGRDPVTVAGLLVHEAVHIWQRYRESIGERTPSHEFEAYSIQWISQELMFAYVSQTKRV